MKFFLSILSFFGIVSAQFNDPAEFSVKVGDVNQGEVALVEVQSQLDFSWRIYAVYDVPEGPSPTKFIINSDIISKVGKVIEPEPTEKFDEGFGNVTKYHEGSPNFIIPIKLNDDLPSGNYNVDIIIDYQVCNNSLCYPPNQVTRSASFKITDEEIRSELTSNNFDFNDSLFARLGFD